MAQIEGIRPYEYIDRDDPRPYEDRAADPVSYNGPTPVGAEAEAEAEAYDPGVHTVDDVLAHADAHPDQVQALYDAEMNGKSRTTLIDGLTDRGAE
jgi:hypothetical protein